MSLTESQIHNGFVACCQLGKLDLLPTLLAQVSPSYPWVTHPLSVAASFGKYESALFLLESRSPNLKIGQEEIRVAFENAIQHGFTTDHVAVVKLLITYGANPAASNNNALRTASSNKALDLVYALLAEPLVNPSYALAFYEYDPPLWACCIYHSVWPKLRLIYSLLGKDVATVVALVFKDVLCNFPSAQRRQQQEREQQKVDYW